VHTGTLPDRSWYRSRMPTGVTLVLLLYARALVCTGRCYVLLYAHGEMYGSVTVTQGSPYLRK